MQEKYNLDDQTFNEILERARLLIPKYYEDWTDQNTHDPGIMLLELFAWLKEMQQYHLSQMVSEGVFYELLGIKPQNAEAARTDVYIRLENAYKSEPAVIPRGIPLYAEDVRYETTEALIYDGIEVAGLQSEEQVAGAPWMEDFSVFSRLPEAGSVFTVLLNKPCRPGRVYKLRFKPGEPSASLRNKANPLKPHCLAEFEWEYLTIDGYEHIRVDDGTFSFTCEGWIVFKTEKKMALNDSGYCEIRCILLWHEYDVPPCVSELSFVALTVKQTHSISEDVTAEEVEESFLVKTYLAEKGDNLLFFNRNGVYTRINEFEKLKNTDGFCIFRIDLGSYLDEKNDNSEQETIQVLSCEAEATASRIIGIADGISRNMSFVIDLKGEIIEREGLTLLVGEDMEMSCAEIWKPVDNFYSSSPVDRHFTVDVQSGEVCFGDGENGAMPKGVVMLASMSLTKGGYGGITANQLTKIEIGERIVAVSQPEPSQGGRETETGKDAFLRLKKCVERAVTAEDVVTLVKRIPGLIIDRVTAYETKMRDECGTTVVVKPYGEKARLSETYRKYIRRYLEPYRIAGTEFYIMSPEYARIDITAEIEVSGRYRKEEYFQDCVRGYFEGECSGFGVRISRSGLMARIFSLPEVVHITTLEMKPHGSFAVSDERGDVRLTPNALVYIGSIDVYIRNPV